MSKWKKVNTIPCLDIIDWKEGFETGISRVYGAVVTRDMAKVDQTVTRQSVIIDNIEDVDDNRVATKCTSIANHHIFDDNDMSLVALRDIVKHTQLKFMPINIREAKSMSGKTTVLISVICDDYNDSLEDSYGYVEFMYVNGEPKMIEFIDPPSIAINNELYSAIRDDIEFSDKMKLSIAESVKELLTADNRDTYLDKINALSEKYIRSIRDESIEIIKDDYFAVAKYQYDDAPDEFRYALHFIRKDDKTEGAFLYSDGSEKICWLEKLFEIMMKNNKEVN